MFQTDEPSRRDAMFTNAGMEFNKKWEGFCAGVPLYKVEASDFE